MFKGIRDAIRELAGAITALVEHTLAHGGGIARADLEELDRRIEELERTRAIVQAEVQGELLRAENERKAARAAEERARAKLKKAEDIVAGSDGEGMEELPEEYRALFNGHAEGSGSQGMLPLRPALGSGRAAQKAAARAMKFGRG